MRAGPEGRGGAVERLYACELEETRHTAMVKACGAAFGYSIHGRLIHGDAFRVRCDLDEANIGASILWLNPPYDQRRGGVRPESVWLGAGRRASHGRPPVLRGSVQGARGLCGDARDPV